MSDLLSQLLEEAAPQAASSPPRKLTVKQRYHLTPMGARRQGDKINKAVVRSRGPAPAPRTAQRAPVRGAIAEASITLLWAILWGLNGVATVWLGWLPLVHWLAARIGAADSLWLSNWLQIPLGIVLHIVISRIEQDLWRQASAPSAASIEDRARALLLSVRTWEAVAFGSFDSATAALGVLMIALIFGAPWGWPLLIASAIIGTTLAMAVEPMLHYHGDGLRRFWRRS